MRPVSLRVPLTVTLTVLLSPLIQPVMAQAPVNDVVSWPAGLLLLATVLYAALGTAPDELWNVDPSIGVFLWTGLPLASVPTMQRVDWVASACHFVPGIRSAYGISNFWIRSEDVSQGARDEALRAALEVMSPVRYEARQGFDETRWNLSSAGLLTPTALTPLSSKEKELDSLSITYKQPSARDFLLFAAADYHVFREWEVRIVSEGKVVFNTLGMEPSSVIDVDSVESALHLVAAHMVRRPHSQSVLRGKARREGRDEIGPYILDLDQINKDVPVCSIDFHSYAEEKWKVQASLNQLAEAYYRVVQHIKQCAPIFNTDPESGLVAHVDVGQTIWIAILGGALLDSGRFTIQKLPGRWGMKNVTPDEAFISRVKEILKVVDPYLNKPAFGDVVFSGGMSRRPAIPFLLAGLFGQIIVCYFLSVGTSAGVWTSVALANSLFTGRLTDLQSLYYGKTTKTIEPGLKMYVPGTTDLMCITTMNKTTPREGTLRPGILLNSLGLVAAILGAVFQDQTRDTLGFNAFQPCRTWVVYTATVLTVGLCFLISATLVSQYTKEKTWWDDASLPTRWMVYFTLPCGVAVAVLGAIFRRWNWTRFWPILDAITWLSGFPLGMLENGRMIATDDNMLHLILVVRWLMGAVASSVGSSR